MFQIKFILNDQPVTVECSGSETLLSVLRDHLGLLGVKEGCGVGECGACTVLLDDRAVNACLVAAGKVQGRQVTTIEGLAVGDRLHPLQQGFLEMGAVQCGFCTPGMLMSASALLKENQHPDEEAIKRGISGNLCRCTGYVKIIEAIKDAGSQYTSN